VRLQIESYRNDNFRVELTVGQQRLSRLARTWQQAMNAIEEIGHELGIQEVHYEGKVILIEKEEVVEA